MAENPIEAICHTFQKVSVSVQTHLSQIVGFPQTSSPTTTTTNELTHPPLFSLSHTDSSVQKSADLSVKVPTFLLNLLNI